MGGIAVVVDYDRPIATGELDSMLALVPHRTADGSVRATYEHAVLVESGTAAKPLRDWSSVTTIGHASIVADLRLWNRDSLRSRAGGQSATAGMERPTVSSSRPICGPASGSLTMSMAISLSSSGMTVISAPIAVRDRFGVKPLFLERTSSGIRFASEVKQLAATSGKPVEPDAHSVAEYILERRPETRSTFFAGIERIRPATAFVIDRNGETEIDYWNPGASTAHQASPAEAAIDFRERLVDSVGRRLGSSDRVVSHLSGGLDSSSIAASASTLVNQGSLDPARFHTASAVFPGHAIDETRWIEEIATRQPFPHHEFIPVVSSTEDFEFDMWIADMPLVDRIRGMWTDTARVARSIDADLVLTGVGGDDLLDHYRLLADRLRSGSFARRWRDLHAHATWRDLRIDQTLTTGLRLVLPEGVKRQARRLLGGNPLNRGLLTEDAWIAFGSATTTELPLDFGYPSDSQNLTVAASRHPLLVWSNELQNHEYASKGLDVSHPYLDRNVVEYLASLVANDHPFDGRSKAIVRQAFSDLLPESVLTRRTKTVADEYLDMLFAQQGRNFATRFPDVTEAAAPFIDRGRYRRVLSAVPSASPEPHTREAIWSAWTLMAWLDGLTRYENRRRQITP